MESEAWRVWNRDDSVEMRTYLRATGELPEMECTKQLVRMISEIRAPDADILDVGCAAGHYYRSLRRLGSDFTYHGIDPTEKYIRFAQKQFADSANATFTIGDVFNLPDEYRERFDIVYCCNVLLHLPEIRLPFRNLIRASRRHVLIRTLIADHTHLSRYLYSDSFDAHGNPTDFLYQNTYSRDLVRTYAHEAADCQVEFIRDEFDPEPIKKEHSRFGSVQDAVTRVRDGVQIAGSKVFEWEWIRITV